MTDIQAPVPFEVLLDYWLGELPEDAVERVDELLFTDDETARRLEVIARLGSGVRRVVRSGSLGAALSTEAVERLRREGVTVRSHQVDPGQTVPCSIGSEDLVSVHLRGLLPDVERVDVEMDSQPEGWEPIRMRHEDVPVDRRRGEVVLVAPGSLIRSLPRTKVLYRLTATTSDGERKVVEYRLEHTP